MKIRINKLISSFLILLLISCKGQNKELKMEKITEEILKLVHTYNTTPIYSLQMNKQGCKLIFEMENNVDYRLSDNSGESIMIPLNAMITKSGKQVAKIKVYPKDGEDYITKYAHIQINVYHAPDKNSSLKDYKKIVEFTLPQGLEEKKLPYYEQSIEFNANVPFDYSKELEQSENLKSIPNIEQKIVKKYEEIKMLCEQYNAEKYNELSIHSSALVYNTTYTSSNEIKEKGKNNQFGIVEAGLSYRTFTPIKNYDIQFYANGKIVALWQKNYQPALYLTGKTFANKDFKGGDPLFLYMPKGSTDLKVW